MSDLEWLRSRERTAPHKWGMRRYTTPQSHARAAPVAATMLLTKSPRTSASAPTPAKPPAETWFPYRENGVTKYLCSSAAAKDQTTTAAPCDDGASTMNLVSSALDEDGIKRFTATGRPMPEFHVSGWANLCDGTPAAPVLLPVRYTDESIIPVVVRLAVGSDNEGAL